MSRALTIAGSDSGAGAGIQADLKTFAAFGVYGSSVITAVTSQNTVAVAGIFELPAAVVASQIDAVMSDIGADAVKTGMLANAEIIEVVCDKARLYGMKKLVVDPVMASKSAAALLRTEAVEVLKQKLLPVTYVLTPNLDEAESILGRAVRTAEEMREAARDLVAMGSSNVLVKGGHLEGEAIDILFDGRGFHEYRAPRVNTKNTHGTGCTFSSAITAGLAKGLDLRAAIAEAKQYLTQAIRASFAIGSGHSPVHHFYNFWKVGDGESR
ncbi:MAG: bifunctional hydroxymethylpyrimidine kinase/phosphomethylpyrimidine kinase [Chloroflexi bacterium]|nr:bifunctional hydroxymethylpyrimidine kinase/phosphomethylpyrimidine kinase [Chloroflexota bacterium]